MYNHTLLVLIRLKLQSEDALICGGSNVDNNYFCTSINYENNCETAMIPENYFSMFSLQCTSRYLVGIHLFYTTCWASK